MAFVAGKVKEVVLKRSVLKELSPVLCKEISKPCVGQDSTGCLVSENQGLYTSVATMEGQGELFVTGTFYRSLNNLYVNGVKPSGITVSIMLRYGANEAELKQIMRWLCHLCEANNVSIMGGETTRSAMAKEHVLTIQALGIKSILNHSRSTKKMDLDSAKIVMAGVAGSAGTLILLENNKVELKKRFSEAFLLGTEKQNHQFSVKQQVEVANKFDVLYAHDVSEGGIFTALWELGEYLNTGLKVDLQQILLSQQTIEFCEIYDWNPYVLYSLGCTLFVTKDAKALQEALNEQGIPASILGIITKEGDRIIDQGDEIRYLEPYKGDEIFRIQQEN